MGAKVAIISTASLKAYVSDVLKILEQPQNFELYYYTDFKSLAALYESLPKHIKGVVTSGSFPCRVIELSFPESNRIIKPFNSDDTSFSRLFLDLLNHDRSLDFRRVYADALDIVGIEQEQYQEFLLGPREASLSDMLRERISKITLDELMSSEDRFARKHIELWKNKKTDISITRFSSILDTLKGAGVNAMFAYPDRFYVRDILLSTIQDVTISELTENLSSSILVTVKPGRNKKRNTEKMLQSLRHSLNLFGVYIGLNYQMKQTQSGFEILTNKEAVKSITDNFSTCKMRTFLADRTGFDTCIGYGIGVNQYQARINAIDAHSEAFSFPYGASCLIDESDQLFSPLEPEKKLIISRDHSEIVKQISRSSGLSCLTIQKIISVMDTLSTEYITSELLSHNLSITKRSANRFLSSLKKAGVANVVETRQSTSMGRPDYIYTMNFQ